MLRTGRIVAKHLAPLPRSARGVLAAPTTPTAARLSRTQTAPCCGRRCRSFSSTPAVMAGNGPRQPRIVAKSEADEEVVRSGLKRLLASEPPSPSDGVGRWSLTANGQGIERSFKFKNFTKTWVREKKRSV